MKSLHVKFTNEKANGERLTACPIHQLAFTLIYYFKSFCLWLLLSFDFSGFEHWPSGFQTYQTFRIFRKLHSHNRIITAENRLEFV